MSEQIESNRFMEFLSAEATRLGRTPNDDFKVTADDFIEERDINSEVDRQLACDCDQHNQILVEPEMVTSVKSATLTALRFGASDLALTLLSGDIDPEFLGIYAKVLAPSEGETSTALDMFTYAMNRGPDETQRATDFFGTVSKAAYSHDRFAREKSKGWRPTLGQVIDEELWQRSGLVQDWRGHGDYYDVPPLFSVLHVSNASMDQALRDGKIFSLLYNNPAAASFIADYRRDSLGLAMDLQELTDLMNIDLSALEAPIDKTPNGLSYWQFCNEALAEAKSAEFTGRHWKGSFYTSFAKKIEELDGYLKEIDPRLESGHLHASTYQSREIVMARLALDQVTLSALSRLYDKKSRFFAAIGDQVYAKDRAVTIEAGRLSTPPYIRSKEGKSCVSTCFRMVFAGITGAIINEKELIGPVLRHHDAEILDQVELLKIFDTNTYNRAYAQKVETITFTGMDLTTIDKITQKLKDVHPDYQVYFTANIRTRMLTDANIWHSVVVTAIDTDSVTFHDPSTSEITGGPDIVMSKREFLNRWACAYNTGYLAISRSH